MQTTQTQGQIMFSWELLLSMARAVVARAVVARVAMERVAAGDGVGGDGGGGQGGGDSGGGDCGGARAEGAIQVVRGGGGDGAMVVATEAAVRGAGGGDSLLVFDRCLSKPSARKAEIGVTDVFGDRRFTFQFIPASTHLRVDHHDARATASDVRPRPRCTTRAT